MSLLRVAMITFIVLGSMIIHGQEDNDDCELVETRSEIYNRLIILSDDGSTNSGELIINHDESSENLGLYFDSSTHQILYWSRVSGQNEDSSDNTGWTFSVDVWDIEQDSYVITELQLPDSFRPVHWLADNRFLFEDWDTDSLVILSIETQELMMLLETRNIPRMRLIPIGFAVGYDISVSPNQVYLAYENEEIYGGISIWNISENRELYRFPNEDGLPLESHPMWSHNSQYVAVANFVETEMQIFLYDVVLNEQTQITNFSSYPSDIENGRPFSTIHTIMWSLDDKYIATSVTFSGIKVINAETSSQINICINGTPRFWLPDNSLIITNTNGVFSFNVEQNTLIQISDEPGIPIGWLP